MNKSHININKENLECLLEKMAKFEIIPKSKSNKDESFK